MQKKYENLNSIERPCQTSAASQIVCSIFKNRIYTFKKEKKITFVITSRARAARARDTHIKLFIYFLFPIFFFSFLGRCFNYTNLIFLPSKTTRTHRRRQCQNSRCDIYFSLEKEHGKKLIKKLS